jgi:hypothetical protein
MKIYTINEIFDDLEKSRTKGAKDKKKRQAKRFRVGGVLSIERAKAKGYGNWPKPKPKGEPKGSETGVESFPNQFPGVKYKRGSVF